MKEMCLVHYNRNNWAQSYSVPHFKSLNRWLYAKEGGERGVGLLARYSEEKTAML